MGNERDTGVWSGSKKIRFVPLESQTPNDLIGPPREALGIAGRSFSQSPWARQASLDLVDQEKLNQWLGSSSEDQCWWAIRYLENRIGSGGVFAQTLSSLTPSKLLEEQRLLIRWLLVGGIGDRDYHQIPDWLAFVPASRGGSLFSAMRNAWNQKVNRAYKADVKSRSVTLDTTSMKKLRSLAKKEGMTEAEYLRILIEILDERPDFHESASEERLRRRKEAMKGRFSEFNGGGGQN